MTQFPHDEFDDVPPYKADEVGKHRAPGAAAASGGSSGGLKWIILLAAVVLLVGAVAWAFSAFGGDDDQPAAEPEDEQATEEPGEQETAEGEAEEGTDSENGEAAQEDQQDAEVDMDYEIIVYNYDGTEGAAGAVREQLDGAGFNVIDQSNWTQGWNTCGETAPVVVHPPAEEELAELIADEIGAATCGSEGWADSDLIGVAVGAESMS